MDIQNHTRLLARARRLSRSPQDAEDLCHEVYLAVLQRKADGARIDRPLPYMMTALRHAALARARSAAREAPLEDDCGPNVEDAGLACLCSQVLAHLDTLPETDRALLRRVALDGLTPSELAAELDIPVGTVMSRLARARARLRRDLDITDVFDS
ncbi:RNA polymerase sigma factor [Marivita sp. S2033]|uniref:RNA polymerase sigma factor n=1 Tax=Marivita sp. S2033 TaxID=3373187 RepID=UPI0039825F67